MPPPTVRSSTPRWPPTTPPPRRPGRRRSAGPTSWTPFPGPLPGQSRRKAPAVRLERQEAEEREAAERRRRQPEEDEALFRQLLAARGEDFPWPPDRQASGAEPGPDGRRRLDPEVREFLLELRASFYSTATGMPEATSRARRLVYRHGDGAFDWVIRGNGDDWFTNAGFAVDPAPADSAERNDGPDPAPAVVTPACDRS